MTDLKQKISNSILKFSGFWDPQDSSLNQRAIHRITEHESWQSDDNEIFIFTAPICRYDFPYMSYVKAYLCVTNKRIFVWKFPNNLQPRDCHAEANTLPWIDQLDTTSITRFKRRNLKVYGFTIPGNFYKAISIRAIFADASNPEISIRKREQWWFWGGEKMIELFSYACLKAGIEIDSPLLNRD